MIAQDESVDALVALGYTLSESKEAVQKCKKDGMHTIFFTFLNCLF
ncbi:hypothetical protein [Clostridioides difficile]